MALNDLAIGCVVVSTAVCAERVGDQSLNVGRRDSGDGASFAGASLQQGVRDIVTIPHALLVRMRRRHRIAAVVEDTPGEKRRRGGSDRRSLHGLFLQSVLHVVKQGPVQDWLMLAGMDLAAISDLAGVEPVLQEMRERAD